MRRKKPNMVRVKGLEPPRHCHQNLNLACLPISPHPRFSAPLLGCIAHLARRTSFLKPFADDIDAFFSPENSKSVRKQNISCKSVPFSCTFLAEAGLAQLVEQLICNHQVGGSSPSAGTTVKPLFRSEAFFISRTFRINDVVPVDLTDRFGRITFVIGIHRFVNRAKTTV